jgi:hypothetical protein
MQYIPSWSGSEDYWSANIWTKSKILHEKKTSPKILWLKLGNLEAATKKSSLIGLENLMTSFENFAKRMSRRSYKVSKLEHFQVLASTLVNFRVLVVPIMAGHLFWFTYSRFLRSSSLERKERISCFVVLCNGVLLLLSRTHYWII